ncbi:MAG: ABC transporter permease, partial [Actinomycetota bacterium]|nr:ABC transporter permease [Actinomycetota bacterium]
MLRLLTGRLLAAFPLMLAVATLVFFLAQLNPVDPAATLLGDDASLEAIAEKRAEMGIDKPLLTQYWDWLSSAATGDLGLNWFNGEDISTELRDRIPVTMSMVFGSLVVALFVGSAFGIFAALKAGRWPDRTITVVSSLGLAVPNFWIGLLLAYYFGVQLQWLPAIWPTTRPDSIFTWVEALILPCTALGISASAAVARQARSSMIGVLQRDYIRTALAKGLPVRRVVSRHAMRNAAIPVVTLAGFQMSALIGGSIFVELVFNVPGLGNWGVDAILRGNLPVLLAFVMMTALTVVLVNIIL